MSDTRLFLHTESPTREVLAARHERGGERWVLASDWIRPVDREIFDACVQLPPPRCVRETLRVLRELAFEHIVVQSEYALFPGVLVAAERGLPAPSPRAAFLCTNKWLSRRALFAAGVPVPRFALARSADDVRAFAESFPLVIKPIASTLGHLVTRVDAPEDLDALVARLLGALESAPAVRACMDFAALAGFELECDPLREFLVEDFAPGEPAETDGFVLGRRIELFGATAQVLCAGPGIYIDGYLFPVERPELLALTPRVVEAVGLCDGGFSIEFRGATVIEINGRLGEDDGFAELFAAGLGEAPIFSWIRREPPRRASGAHALAYRNVLCDARVGRIGASDGARVLVEPGQQLHAPPHVELQPHVAYALRSHASDAQIAYREARAAVDAVEIELLEGAQATSRSRSSPYGVR